MRIPANAQAVILASLQNLQTDAIATAKIDTPTLNAELDQQRAGAFARIQTTFADIDAPPPPETPKPAFKLAPSPIALAAQAVCGARSKRDLNAALKNLEIAITEENQ